MATWVVSPFLDFLLLGKTREGGGGGGNKRRNEGVKV